MLVLCGAESTEPDYFRALKRTTRNPAISVSVKDKSVDPAKLVKYAENQFISEYDEVWCVVDVDEYDVAPAAALALRCGVNLAVSDPCFEYWLLLHFEDCAAPMTRFSEVETRLKKHLPNYDKRSLRFEDFRDRVAAAVDRAQVRCPGGTFDRGRNPSTGVWLLVASIRGGSR